MNQNYFKMELFIYGNCEIIQESEELIAHHKFHEMFPHIKTATILAESQSHLSCEFSYEVEKDTNYKIKKFLLQIIGILYNVFVTKFSPKRIHIKTA